MMGWLEEKKVDVLQWTFEQTLGDPSGAIAVLGFVVALFVFKPTRIFAVGSIVLYVIAS